jgi:hypothetical protein
MDNPEDSVRLEFVLRTASDEDLLRALTEFEEEMTYDNLSMEALVAHSWVVEEGLRRYMKEVVLLNAIEWGRLGGADLSMIEYLDDTELDELPSIAHSLKKVLTIVVK